jgi:type I restriction enzyme, S subunit
MQQISKFKKVKFLFGQYVEIPIGWEIKTFNELFEFLRTGTSSRDDLKERGDIQYIHYGDIHTKWHFILDCNSAQIPWIDKAKVLKLPFLIEGDLIVADASEDYEGSGASILLKNVENRKIVSGLHTIALRNIDKNIYSGFKTYLTSIRFVKRQITAYVTGISVYGLSKNNLKKIKIPLPPYQEQQKIASILSKVDELIQKTDLIVVQTQKLKKGLMQKLFTTGAGSAKSKVDFVTLGDYADVKGRIGWRGLKKHEYVESGPYMISGYNLINRRIMWNECLHISYFRYDESPEIQLKLNDVIMVKDGVTLGRVGFIDYLPGPATINSTLVLIRDLSGKFFPEFLFYFFQGPTFQNIIKERVSGFAVPHIFQRDIKDLKIPIFDLIEQKRIASMLSQLDKYYEKQIEISNMNKNLKRGLIQKLLTGNIRVKV